MRNLKDHSVVGERIRREDRNGVAILWLDHTERSMNVVDEQLLAELATQVTALEADEAITGVVLASAKSQSFGAGADVTWLPELAARSDADAYLASVHDLMWRISRSHRPFVSAVNGPAYGGALEIALATEAMVATSQVQLGLPEISLGLIPGGAGTQLIRRWVTTEDALGLMLTGRSLTADQAKDMGILTEVVAADDLVDAAVALARALAVKTERRSWRVESQGDARAALARLRDTLPDSDAARKILQVVSAGVEHGFDAGCKAERTAFLALLNSSAAKARMHLFVVESDIKRRSKGSGTPIWSLGIVGGGQMGSGIAATAVRRGLDATVRDISEEKLAEANGGLATVLSRAGLAGASLDEAGRRWHGTTDWEGFSNVEAVVEAVFELPELKQETLRQLSHEVPIDALVTTNTSAIPIHSLVPAVVNPTRFMGMHFFSPVDRMPLVELIPHAGTSQETVARASALTRQLGKVPVVVADVPGFFTSRVYARWLIEGVRLLMDGVPAGDIDSAAKSAGFPIGPLQAHDEATLDLVLKASITQVADKVMADRIDVTAVREALEKLIAGGVLGRRQGAGFYTYTDGRRSGINPRVAEILGRPERTAPQDAVGERLLLAFATECFLCWDDATLCHPDDGDIASVLGIGFPRVLGGPFHWADQRGGSWILDRCESLGVRAFPVGTTLPELAQREGSWSREQRRDKPGRASTTVKRTS